MELCVGEDSHGQSQIASGLTKIDEQVDSMWSVFAGGRGRSMGRVSADCVQTRPVMGPSAKIEASSLVWIERLGETVALRFFWVAPMPEQKPATY